MSIMSALSRKLVFGDLEQIAAVKFMEAITPGPDDVMKQYAVTVWYGGNEVVMVKAHNEKGAISKATEMCEMPEFVVETNVREVKA